MNNATENDLQLWADFNEKLLTEEYFWVNMIYVVFISILFVASMVGNLLTCVVIYTDRSMHTATNYYLFNLAVSDMVLSLAVIMEVHEHLSKHFFVYSYDRLTCKIHYFLVVTLWNHGVLVMTALAVERYMAICYPLMLKSKPVWRRVGKIIAIIWVVAITLSLPDLWTINLTKTAKGNVCYLVPTYEARIVNCVLALVIYVIPLGTMVFVYTMIACKVSSMQRASGRDKVFNHRDNRSKVNKLVALTLTFLVCWFPFFTVRLIIFALDVKQIVALGKWWSVLYLFVGVNCWLSSVLNPLLFSLMSTKFRMALKILWNRNLKKLDQDNRATMV